MDDFLVGGLLGLVAGFMFGAIVGFNVGQSVYHTRNCVTQFYHAKTSADSLLVVQDDKFCAKVIEKTK